MLLAGKRCGWLWGRSTWPSRGGQGPDPGTTAHRAGTAKAKGPLSNGGSTKWLGPIHYYLGEGVGLGRSGAAKEGDFQRTPLYGENLKIHGVRVLNTTYFTEHKYAYIEQSQVNCNLSHFDWDATRDLFVPRWVTIEMVKFTLGFRKKLHLIKK